MYIVFDIGGTTTRIARSADLKTFDDPVVYKTPGVFDDAMKKMKREIRLLANGEEIIAMAGGIAGVLDHTEAQLVASPHLDSWVNQPLAQSLQEMCSHVYLRNDSAMVGLGEAVFGAGQGGGIMAYITISTGVGGVRIVDNVIDQFHSGFEPGHQIIDVEHMQSLEQMVSGSALEDEYGKSPKDINNPEVWVKVNRNFAVGLYNMILMWSPDRIVIGGGMMVRDEYITIDKLIAEIKKLPEVIPELPEMKQATLDDFGGLYGGMAYLKQVKNI